MICKIDALRGCDNDNNFFNKLLGTFEGKSMELERLKKTLKEMKGLKEDYVMFINELEDQHQKAIKEKDQEISYLKKLQALLIGKQREGYQSEPSRVGGERKDLKIEELDEESQLMIANIKALRESDDMIHDKVLNMLERQNSGQK